MSTVVTQKIDTELPLEVLVALAKACGFSVHYDRTPGVDSWKVCHRHSPTNIEHVGTRQAICAFLTGYADMQMLTTQILNDVDNAGRRLVLEMRERLGQR